VVIYLLTDKHPGSAEESGEDAAAEPTDDAAVLAEDEDVAPRDPRVHGESGNLVADSAPADHATPWPQGATHPGNLGPKCRTHHLLKTFPAADGGWVDVQHPDGSHTWTAPTGHTYRTTPFGQILFPHWNIQAFPLPPTGPAPTPPARGAGKTPTRKRTRQQTCTQRISAERRLNEGGKAPPF
jgi:hypothetical protein